MRRSAGPFQAGAGVQTDKTAEALKEFFNELNRMLQPIPADELEKAKNYAALSFPGEFETTGQLAVKLEEMAVYDLPEDTFTSYVGAVQKTAPADMARVAKSYLLHGPPGGGDRRRPRDDRSAGAGRRTWARSRSCRSTT